MQRIIEHPYRELGTFLIRQENDRYNFFNLNSSKKTLQDPSRASCLHISQCQLEREQEADHIVLME